MKINFLAGCTLAVLSILPARAHISLHAASYQPPVYTPLPLGSIKPAGWLRHQLLIMRDGSTGHLDEYYAKLKNDNGWLGGNGDGWEETPYWLDGALPLAYLLDDKALKEKVLRYVNWTLDHQRPSGYFGPLTGAEREKHTSVEVANATDGDDWWPKMVMLKVLQQYYSATGDQRVITFMTKYFRYQQKALDIAPIGKWTDWAASRGADNVMMAQWLYSITKDPSLLLLADKIEQQSFPWTRWMGGHEWVISTTTYAHMGNWMNRHGVNVAMALKSPAISYQRTGDPQDLQALRTGWHDLMTVHGLPMGIFSGDEDLNGNEPTQGIELCAIVEAMYSMENIISITGDVHYMDALEKMAFNALPTQTTDDYNNKQYFQVANQVQISKGVFDFSLPFSREMCNVLGPRSGYTCCLANMHQGWTKFTAQLWYSTPDKGIAALSYAPNDLTTKVGTAQTEVTIHEATTYPFNDEISFTLSLKKAASFPLQLRIPAWCKEANILLNGQPLRKDTGNQVITINRSWKNNDKLVLQLPMDITTTVWGRHSRAIERGPLVYALKLNERWEKATDEVEGEYFSVYATDKWNYALIRDNVDKPAAHFKAAVVKQVDDQFVWNLAHAPVTITVPAKSIPSWKELNGVAFQPPTDREGIYKGKVDNTVQDITLVPYGCTKVRIVAFPVVP